LTKAIAVLR